MKILIIGSEGFIGKNCVAYFSGKEHDTFSCDIIERPIPEYFYVNPFRPDFDSVLDNIIPNVCINASGSADVGFSFKNKEKDFELNVKNVELLLESIRKYSPNCKLINFSSAAVYGNPKFLPINESAELNPLSPYGIHKLKSEILLKEYYDKYNISTCSLRIFSAYGPGLKKQLFWDIYQKSMLGKNINLFGTGEESRDFIFIDDLVRAIDIIIRYGKFCGETINVSSGTETKVKDAASVFLSFLDKELSVGFSGEIKGGDPRNWKADITLLKEIGFIPFVTFEEGIKRYATWLKELKSE